ncbi:MAG: hypothetical protein IPO08_22055 [Xanthomonadales bacterium]|nr:hypothetical protein [Xanthomonadales bacterium]
MPNPIEQAMAPQTEEDWYRSTFLPVETRKGEARWAVPGMIKEPWDAWTRQYDNLWDPQPMSKDQIINDAFSVAGVMMPGAMAKGGVARRGAARTATEAENPIHQGLRQSRQPQKSSAEATHSAYREVPEQADDDLLDWTNRSVDPNFDWRKHVRVRKADNSDMTPLDHAKKRAVEEQFKRLQDWKAEHEVGDDRLRDLMGGGRFEEDWIGGARPPLSQTPYVMPEVDEYLAWTKEALTTPEDMDRHYRTLINEIRIGERMQPGEVAWLEAYEKQFKPRAPTHPGNNTLHAGSPFAGMVGTEEDQR